MAIEALTEELARIALRKLSGIDMKEAAGALKAFGKASTGAALLPGLGAFGAGVAIGVGVTLLVAPQSGKQTRAFIAGKLKALRGWRRGDAGTAERESDSDAGAIETRGSVVG